MTFSDKIEIKKKILKLAYDNLLEAEKKLIECENNSFCFNEHLEGLINQVHSSIEILKEKAASFCLD